MLASLNGFTVNWVKQSSLMMTSSDDSQSREIPHVRELWTASWQTCDLKPRFGGYRQVWSLWKLLTGSNKTCSTVEKSSCRHLGVLRGPAKLNSTSQRRWPFARRQGHFWSFSAVRRVSGQPTDSHRRRSNTCDVRRPLDRERHRDNIYRELASLAHHQHYA